ncbi:two-component system VirA-like sensor kinase [Rhodopseudomonas palustris]|uniref:two-component system VirA-like sensor kinase n=1 Tax=Rhodopseudomonas palustris TaxID=1076 RepID=UPI002ACE1E11|nr:two-component system VirA-like sensor kinase [Rhodopseudomonas palustris]WQG98833.1 two-component system VirA-like sensor kinase [Rhodopseudomonas palustris]
MVANSRTRSQHTIGEQWRIGLLALVAVLFGAVALVLVPSRDVHDGVLASLRMIDLQHASLQRDVLQARAGLLKNYDPLAVAIARLHATTDNLRNLLAASRRDGISGLDDGLDAISAAVAFDESLVDRFKTSNSLLQNSLEIFNQLLSQRYLDPYSEGQPPSERSGHLGNLMMRFASNPSADFEVQIRAELDGLKRQLGAPSSYVRGLASHAGMILKTLPLLDQTTLALQGAGTLNTAEDLRRRYLDAYETMIQRSTRHRVILGSVSLAMFGFVAMLVWRLQESRRTEAQQRRFERTLDELRRQFGDNYTTLEAAVEAGLDLLAAFFEGRKGRFTIFDAQTGDIEYDLGLTSCGTWDAGVTQIRVRMRNDVSATDASSALNSRNVLTVRRGRCVDAAVIIPLEARSAALLQLNVGDQRANGEDELSGLLDQAAECLAACVRLVQDREEKEALHARLEHAQRLEAVGALAGGIAHEFNNILLAMMGYSEMALDACAGDATASRYIQETIHSGHRAKLVIDQVLAFSRKGTRVSKPFDICEAVHDVLPLLTVSLPDHVALDVDLPRRRLTVTGNPIEIQQIVMNVCRNAAQACRESALITITLSAVELRSSTRLSHGRAPPGSYAVLAVADTGDGIAPGAMPHIFEPFFTTRSEGGGTGLGLAAVHGAIVGMAGHVDVQSRVGAGTRFDLYFPITHRPSVSIRDFTPDQSVPMGAGQTIVIAEADDAARLMYEEKAAALGYEPIGFSNLTDVDGWISKRGHAADLVMLDSSLWPDQPDPSRIKQRFRPIPVLLISHSAISIVAESGSANRLQVLGEPVTTTRLARAISTALAEADSACPDRALSRRLP